MALVRFGGGVSELRGSIAGNVFSRSRAGAIVRNRTVPVNPNTIPQSDVRAFFHAATDSWSLQTPAQRDLYTQFAETLERKNRFGEAYVPSGKQVYTEQSMNAQLIGLTADAPALASSLAQPNIADLIGGVVNLTVVASAITVLTITGLTSSQPTGSYVIVQATMPLPETRRNVQGNFRQIFGGALADPLDIEAGYVAQFGATAPAGLRIHFRLRAVDSENFFTAAWTYFSVLIP